MNRRRARIAALQRELDDAYERVARAYIYAPRTTGAIEAKIRRLRRDIRKLGGRPQ